MREMTDEIEERREKVRKEDWGKRLANSGTTGFIGHE